MYEFFNGTYSHKFVSYKIWRSFVYLFYFILSNIGNFVNKSNGKEKSSDNTIQLQFSEFLFSFFIFHAYLYIFFSVSF